MIVQTVSETMFLEAFRQANHMDNFSPNALRELYAHLSDLSAETGENIMLDVIAICCFWQEMDVEELQDQYDYFIDMEELEECEDDEERLGVIQECLQDHTTVIRVERIGAPDTLLVQAL